MSLAVNGPAIRAIREAQRINIADLAKEIGVSRSYLAKIELGHRKKVGLDVVAALERALLLTDRRAILASPFPEAD